MTRRSTYSRVKKKNRIRADYAKGMSDIVFLGFQCLNPDCTHFIFVRQDELEEDFDIECPECNFHLKYGEETTFYDYQLEEEKGDEKIIIEEGAFSVFHEEYLESARQYKYCIVCNTLKPLDAFHKHSSRKSGRQGECIVCKNIYNDIKNQTRITDQHREASQKRRLLLDITEKKINSSEVYKKFNFKCFNCNKDLSEVSTPKERPLDHTLPIYYLWPLTTETATLLCQDCNSSKSGKWPSEYYNKKEKIKQLSVKTGYPERLMAGKPQYNPDAIEKLKNPDFIDELLAKYSNYMEKTIIPLRNRLLNDINFDFFKFSNQISKKWIEKANREFERKY